MPIIMIIIIIEYLQRHSIVASESEALDVNIVCIINEEGTQMSPTNIDKSVNRSYIQKKTQRIFF